ncbi:MAG: TIGR01457 family HAD-type hydrolase [Caldibacillus sp.]
MKYRAYLIDLDGTMYKGTEKIPAAADFVRRLKEKGLPYLFVTNNSTQTPEDVAAKLRGFDIPAEKEQVFTTALATAEFVSERWPEARVYFTGEEGLARALAEKGFPLAREDADVVIIGLDRQVTYEKFAVACLAIRNGARFISTNGDVALPTERGLMPGNGSLTALVSTSTQKKPIFIGKPEPIIIDMALKYLGVKKGETLIVGDNYHTDILAGIKAGIDTLLVHTGVTSKDDLARVKIQPTYSLDSLDEWELI